MAMVPESNTWKELTQYVINNCPDYARREWEDNAEMTIEEVEQIYIPKANLKLEGFRMMAQINFENLLRLDIDDNELSDKGMILLCKMNLSKVKELSIKDNEITDIGFRHVIQKIQVPCITEIIFGGNKITDEGMKLLAKVNWKTLNKIFCQRNPIGESGVYHFCMTNLSLTTFHAKAMNVFQVNKGRRIIIRKFIQIKDNQTTL